MAESIRGRQVKDWTDRQLNEHGVRLIEEKEKWELDSHNPFPKAAVLTAVNREKLQRKWDRGEIKNPDERTEEWLRRAGVKI